MDLNWSYIRLSELSPEDYRDILDSLSDSRKNHVARFQKEDDRRRSLAGEYLARRLAAEAGVTDARLERLAGGQPVFDRGGLHLSIAHSRDLVVCAVDTAPIGIDAELLRPFKPGLLRHVCTPEEQDYVLGNGPLPEDLCQDRDKITRFFEIWTAKEAWFKKQGTGITDLKSVNILPMARQIFYVDDYMIQIL